MSFNPDFLPTVGGATQSGVMGMEDVAEMRKALTAGYGSTMESLTGGGSLRIQSLEKTMLSTIVDNKHFKLFNALQKSNATATVDEWTEQSGIGGFNGSSVNTETGVIAATSGDYARRVGLVKYLMTRREISAMLQNQNAIVSAEAVEHSNAALQLLRDAEYLCFEGDSSIIPTEFDGIYAQMVALADSDHIIDAAGQSLASIALVDEAAATIYGNNNFGQATHLFMSMMNQSDFNTNLDPAWRVNLNGSAQSIVAGSPVTGIQTSWGTIETAADVFIRDERQQKPFEVENAATAVANLALQPASFTATEAAGDASSKWGAAHAGLYYYAVAGLSAAGQSAVVVSAQKTVAQGEKITLVITKSAGGTENGYVIYRGRKGGTNAVSDLRFVARIPYGGATTTWVDNNLEIPGTSKAYLLSMKNDAITWRQYMPMSRYALYPTNAAVNPFAILLAGFLRIGKRRQQVVIKNICPAGNIWKPFQ
jgi:hypothetical protein